MSAKKGSSLGLKLLVVLVIVAGIAFVAQRQLRPVARVEPVVSGDAYDARPASVTAEVEYSEDLQPEIGGRLIKDGYALEVGKPVSENQVVARIDPADLELDIDQVQHDLDAAKAKVAVGSSIALELVGAQSELDNEERLYKMGQVSELDLKKARRTVEQTKQKLALEKVNNQQAIDTLTVTLEQKKRQLSKMTMRAPFDGLISAVYAHPGQEIPNNFVIATMIPRHNLVVAKISEEDFADIKVGDKAAVSFLPYGDYVFNGSVSKILPTADPLTQRHIVWIELTDIPPEKLVPGITGDASITVSEHHANAIVPRRAVIGGNSIYVVKDGVVELRKVRKGAVWLTGIEILPVDKSGPPPLSPGELVIVEELDRFREGDHVQVLEMPSDAIPKER